MAEETTLLVEKETETVKQPKVKLVSKEKVIEKKEKEISKKLFSAPLKKESAVEKPNFDTLPELMPEKRKRVFKVEREVKAEKKKGNPKLKLAIISVCFVVLTAFCITTGIEIAKASQSLQLAQSEYSANLLELTKKIYSTETGNRSLSLFETYPEEDLTAVSIYETSNWFDRLCKFLSNFFGG